MGAGLEAGELLPDFDLATLIFLKLAGFLAEGAMARLLVREDGDPLELLVVDPPTTNRPEDLFKGLLLLPTLALCWRPLLDILGVGV